MRKRKPPGEEEPGGFLLLLYEAETANYGALSSFAI